MNTVVRTLLTSRGFHLGMGGFLLCVYALRVLLFPGASEDDAEQLFYAQSLVGGYKPGQPPLYTWIVYVITQITGPTLPVVVAIKFIFLGAIYGLSYRIARLMGCLEGWAAFAGFSVFGLYYIGWDSVLNYSQTVLMAALCLAAIHALARIMNGKTGWVDFLYFGLIMGCGLMTKYNFALFLIALLVAGLMDRDLRRVLLRPKGLSVLVLAGLIFLPHGLWLLGGAVDANDLSKAMTPTDRGALSARFDGLMDMVDAVASILSPLLIFYALIFPKSFKPIDPELDSTRRGLLLLNRGGIIILVLMALMIIVSGVTSVRNHWFIVLIAFPVYGTLRISEVYRDLEGARVIGYIKLLILLAAVVMIVLGGRAWQGPDRCSKCRLIVPYSQLADQVRDAGFEHGTIITADYPSQVGGNLRRYFPDSRFISTRFKLYNPPMRNSDTGQCLAVWHMGPSQTQNLKQMQSALKNRLGVNLRDTDHMQTADVTLSGDTVMQFGFMLINDPARQGTCR